jgi:hypothetical protein
MTVLKLYGHDNARSNKNKKVTIQNGWIEENVICKCQIMQKILTQTISIQREGQKYLNFFEDCSYSNKKYKRLQELCCTALPVLCISASSRMMMGR